MLPQETVGLLLDGDSLAASQLGSHEGDANLAGPFATRAGQHGPEIRAGDVLWNTTSHPVISTEGVLRTDMALLGGSCKPADGHRIILLNIFSCGVARGQCDLPIPPLDSDFLAHAYDGSGPAGNEQFAHRLTGAVTSQLRDGLLDTGADDTVFSDAVAAALGVDLSRSQQRSISLAGRPQPLLCQYVAVHLRITDGIETLEWPATVGFVAARLHYALLGQAGFLQFFDADFGGDSRVLELETNPTFAGTKT